MKNLLLVAAVSVLGLSLYAQSTPQSSSAKIKMTDASIYNAEVVLLNVITKAPNCPPGAACAPAAFAQLKINFNGCLDRLVVLSHNITRSEDQKITLNVAAVSAVNKKSAVAKCFVLPSQIVEVFVGAGFMTTTDSVELNVLR